MISDDGQEVENLQNPVDGAVTKERRLKTIIEYLQEQLLSARSDADKCLQRTPLYTGTFTADVTDGFSGSLYIVNGEVKRLVEKQCKNIETTMKRDLEFINAFMRTANFKLDRRGQSC